ncbi:hypothetical protein [uncultured Sneathiella sp.]|uniref:hypothetical protein n=1 Tax=uncultured Sneathiella sp. TaxID=879315 RepID=UPI0030D89878|tara:strand:- start:132 stop:614 length:483 start_codon:yes stop_codon:yes gene_type:complete
MTASNKAMLFVFPVLWALIPLISKYTGLPFVFPFPILWFLSALFVPEYLLYVVPIIGYFLTLIPIFKGNVKFSKTQLIVIVVVLILNIIWAITNWDLGIRYKGILHTAVAVAISMVIGGFLIAYFINFRNHGTFNKKVLLNGMIWLWLLCYSFPALGELM